MTVIRRGRNVTVSMGAWVESPSLADSVEGRPSFELKFLLDEALALRVEERIREQLTPDPHGDAALGGAYHTTTLYVDTPYRDVFHRSPRYKRHKYRLRRYGLEASIYLERKSRDGDRVWKQRTRVSGLESAVLDSTQIEPDWAGAWFHEALLDRGLRPVCLVYYRRLAFAGMTSEGPVRVTMDRELAGAPTHGWEVRHCPGRSFLTDCVIVELKFRAALPAVFKDLVREFCLNPRSASKYRHCLRVWGEADRA
jgi:VTC domain